MSAPIVGHRQILFATTAGAILSGALVIADVGGSAVQTVCALLLIFALPATAICLGVSISARRAERAAIGVALGVTILILGSVLFDALEVKLDQSLWVILMAASTVLLAVAGLVFNSPRWSESQPAVRVSAPKPSSVAWVIAAIALVSAAVLISISSKADQNSGEQFTALWAVPQGATGTVLIGIKNGQDRPRTYSVRAFADDRPISSWRSVTVDTDQGWHREVSVPTGADRIRLNLVSRGPGKTIRRSAIVSVR